MWKGKDPRSGVTAGARDPRETSKVVRMKSTVPLRRIGGLFHPYRRLMVGLLFLVLVQSAVGVAAPFFLRAIPGRPPPARGARPGPRPAPRDVRLPGAGRGPRRPHHPPR